MEYRKCGNSNSKNDSRSCLGASAILKSVDFTAFGINVKTIAPKKSLYQSGHAIWWYREPSIIDTFLEAYDFSGKKIVPFCTSGSSGIGDTAKRMQEIVKNGVVLEGKRFPSDVSVDEFPRKFL